MNVVISALGLNSVVLFHNIDSDVELFSIEIFDQKINSASLKNISYKDLINKRYACVQIYSVHLPQFYVHGDRVSLLNNIVA